MMNELDVSPKENHRGEVKHWIATVIRDYAGRLGLGPWIFVGPGSENTWHFDKGDTL